MGTFSLLLLVLGLVLVGVSESIMEPVKEEFAGEEMQYDTVKSGQEKQTAAVLMNLTLLDNNTSFGMSKNAMPSSLLTFRRSHYSVPKANSPRNDRECCIDITVWRKALEANGSCKLSNNFVHGPMEVTHGVHKAPGCKCGQNPGISCCESRELENTMCQLALLKQYHRCQYHSITSLKKMLTVLTGHSLMSWLVSGSKL